MSRKINKSVSCAAVFRDFRFRQASPEAACAPTWPRSIRTLAREPNVDVATCGGHVLTRGARAGVLDADRGAGRSLSSGGPPAVPQQARVVVCGGGVLGTSTAFHLAELGWTDVVLLEQGQLTCGTTWHSVGLISTMRNNRAEVEIMRRSVDLYSSWEAEGDGVGWRQCGSLNIARTKDRMTGLLRQHAVAKTVGVEVHVVTPTEIQSFCPNIRVDDLEGGLWIPGDGALTAPDAAQVFARKARAKGVKVVEGVSVERVLTEKSRVSEVVTSAGNIKCEYFVNAAGMWSRELGKRTSPHPLDAPLHACEHYYLVTKPVDGTDPLMPVVRDYDGYVYVREWNGGIIGGGFEPDPKPCFPAGPPHQFHFQLLQEDWDQFQILMENVMHRVPAMETAEIRQLTNGPESFTSDGRWLLGESPKISNYFYATGGNSKGIAGAGGIGWQVAQWIVDGRPGLDLWPYDVRRFTGIHNNKRFLKERMVEAFAAHPLIPFPRVEYQTGRNLRRSPMHAREEAQGAVFGEVMAHEIALYFRPGGAREGLEEEAGFGRPVWVEAVREEHAACTESAGILDMSALAKFTVTSAGSEAAELLQKLCSNDVDVAIGGVVHTGLLNEQGGFENLATVARLDTNRFLLTCPALLKTRAEAWLRRTAEAEGRGVVVADVSSGLACVGLVGPRAAEVLQGVTEAGDAPGPGTWAPLDEGVVMRTGHQSFLVLVPSEQGLMTYDALAASGADYGLRAVGQHALTTLRLQQDLPAWGPDLGDTLTPLEAGMDHIVCFTKGEFTGRAALERQRADGVRRRLVRLELQGHDDQRHLWAVGAEPVYRGGRYAGLTASCGPGPAGHGLVCLAFVADTHPQTEGQGVTDPQHFVKEGLNYEVDIAGKRFPAKASLCNPQTLF